MNKPRFRCRFFACLSIFGMLILSYLTGAAVIYFGLPTSDYLHKGFVGARAWNERRKAASAIIFDE